MADSNWKSRATPVSSSNDWKSRATPIQDDSEKPGILHTIADQAGQGATFGLGDEINGIGEAAGRALGLNNTGTDMTNISQNPEGPTMDWDKIKSAYIAGRDKTRGQLSAEQSAHPVTSFASNVAGALANPMSAGGGLAKATALGATAGFGSSDAELAGPNKQIGKAVVDTGMGGALGLGAGLLGKAAGLSADSAKAAGASQAAKAVGLAPGIDKGAEAAGQSLLDAGALPVTGSQQVLNQSVQGAKQAAGQNIGSALSNAQSGITDDAIHQAGPISEKFADLTENFLKDSNLSDIDARQVLNKAKSEYSRVAESEGDLNALNKVKRDFKQLAKKTYGPNSPSQNSSVQNFYNRLADMVKTHIEDLGNAGEEGAGDEIASANSQYGPLKNAADNTSRAAKSEALSDSGLMDIDLAKPKSYVKALSSSDPGLLLKTGAANALNSPVTQAAAEATGVASEIASPIVKGAVNSGDAKKSMYQQHQQQYRTYSDKLLANPSTQHLGKALDTALNSNNELSKTQALFVIQQNPQARKVIDGSGQ